MQVAMYTDPFCWQWFILLTHCPNMLNKPIVNTHEAKWSIHEYSHFLLQIDVRTGIQAAMYTNPFCRQWFVVLTHLTIFLEQEYHIESLSVNWKQGVRRFVRIELPKWFFLYRGDLYRWSCEVKIPKHQSYVFSIRWDKTEVSLCSKMSTSGGCLPKLVSENALERT